MRKRADRLKKVRKLVGEVPKGLLKDARDLDIQHETRGNVHAEATKKTTRRAP